VDGSIDFGSWQEVLWEHSRGSSDHDLFPSTSSEPIFQMGQEAVGFQGDPARIDWLTMPSNAPMYEIDPELMALSRDGTSTVICLVLL
jgi:hypothetical protein